MRRDLTPTCGPPDLCLVKATNDQQMHTQINFSTGARMTKHLLSLSFLVLLAYSLSAQISGQIFNTPGTQTWTAPQGVWEITVECYGGGGRGASVNGSANGGGGGGGAYSKKNIITVTPGQTYTFHVGAGSTSEAPGEDTWFINTATVMAKGGNSAQTNNGNGASGGQASASVGDIRYNGGNGNNGLHNASGGGGSSAGHAAHGVHANGSNGASAPAGGGNGGNGTNGNNGGSPGSQPGGGGGGANAQGNHNRIGGQGGHGRLIISWMEEQEAPLPVELSHFSAWAAPNGVNLTWTTMSEINSEYFSIEYSTDARSFQPVGIVDAYGFSNKRRDYSWTHLNTKSGNLYYRLKIVDFDGSYEYSSIVVVQRDHGSTTTLSARMTPGNILIEEAPATLNGQGQLFDTQGRQIAVFQLQPGAMMQEFQIPMLNAGIYMLHLVQQDGTPLAIKLWHP